MTKTEWLMLAAGIGVLYMAGSAAAPYVETYLGSLSISQIKTLAANAGFAGEDLDVAAAVAMAESSGDPNAVGDVGIPVPGSQSYGLWQINSYFHPEFGPDFTKLFDPTTNAAAAYSVYRVAGYSFSPWTTFKTGAYSKYLPAAQSA